MPYGIADTLFSFYRKKYKTERKNGYDTWLSGTVNSADRNCRFDTDTSLRRIYDRRFSGRRGIFI